MSVSVVVFVGRMGVGMIVRRSVGVRVLVGVLLVRVVVFVVTVIVTMSVRRTVGVRMGMRVFVALHSVEIQFLPGVLPPIIGCRQLSIWTHQPNAVTVGILDQAKALTIIAKTARRSRRPWRR
jgi:hypothetical protein